MGVTHQESDFYQDGIEAKDRFTNLTHFALVVPFGNRFGLAIGLKPFSRTGYEINRSEVVEGDSIFYDYFGRGEIQEFVIGFSTQIVKNMNHSWSIGANGKRFFGRSENESRAYQKNGLTTTGVFQQGFFNAAAFGYTLGTVYRYTPSSKHSLTLGGYLRTPQNLNMRRASTRVFYGNASNVGSYDTLVPLINREGTILMPQKMTLGISYEFKPARDSVNRSGRVPSLLFTAEYTDEQWTKYEENFEEGVGETFQFFDKMSLRAGFQYIPHRYINDQSNFVKFYQKWSYRFGAFQVALPYELGGEQVIDRGITFGLGMPIIMSRAVSNINLSVVYGDRGLPNNSTSFRENYLGFNFGVNIAPSYDRWFVKYKLD